MKNKKLLLVVGAIGLFLIGSFIKDFRLSN